MSREEVLDAFDMMELALTNLFDDGAAEIMKKVKAVIKAKEKNPKPEPAAAAATPATVAGPMPGPAPTTKP